MEHHGSRKVDERMRTPDLEHESARDPVAGAEWRERGESWRRGVGQGAEERPAVAAAGRRRARVSGGERRAERERETRR
jgi:hypothetical protein